MTTNNSSTKISNKLDLTKDSLVIPTELIAYVYKNGLIEPFKSFIILKTYFRTGRIKYGSNIVIILQKTAGIKTKKTMQSHLEKLIELKWMGWNGNVTFLRSFPFIHKQLKLQSRSCTVFYPEIHIEQFRPFLAAAIIGHHAKCKLWRERRKNSAKTGKRNPVSSSQAISIPEIMKLLNVAKGTASTAKKDAAKFKFIEVKKNLRPLVIDKGEQGVKQFTKNHLKALLNSTPEIAHKIKVKKGFLFEQETDSIKPLLDYKRRKLKRNERKTA